MAEHTSTITPFQKKLLTQYQSFYNRPPSMRSLIELSARGQLLLIVIFASASVLCFSIGIAPIGFITIGMLVGAISRDIGQFRKLTQAWPVLNRIIDWPTLNSLLGRDPLQPDA